MVSLMKLLILKGQGEIAEQIAEQFGFQPMVTSFLDESGLLLFILTEGTVVQISIPESLSRWHEKGS